MKLLRPVPLEEIVVGKCLQSSGLAHGQAAALRRVIMNGVMTILGEMAHHRRRRLVCKLDPEPVVKLA